MVSINSIKASDGTGNASVATVQNSRSAGATTIVVDTVQGMPTDFYASMGTPHTFVDPITDEEITVISEATAVDFKGHLDGINIEIDEIAPGQTDKGSSAGDIIMIKPTTQWANNVADVLSVAHNDDGSLKAVTDNPGWTALTGTELTTASGYNKGNRSCVLNSNTDLTGVLSKGMRFRINRDTAAPTQCADLEKDSSQYFTKSSPTGITFTDDFTIEAWIEMESYGPTNQHILGRYSSTGFLFRVNSSGQLRLDAIGAASDVVLSNQSVPLGKKVHVAATMDMSASTGKIYIDGVEVSTSYTNGASTTLTQAGNLAIGSLPSAVAELFDGKISDVRLWNTIRTQTEIRDNMYQQLTGTETNLIGYWKLDGDANDSTSNANHMTAMGGAGFVTDNQFKDTEYGIITDVTPTQVTVFCPEGHGIPNQTLTAPYYSTQKVPFGFPAEKDKWSVELFRYNGTLTDTNTDTSWRHYNNVKGVLPSGSWTVKLRGSVRAYISGSTSGAISLGLSTTTNDTGLIHELTVGNYMGDSLSGSANQFANTSGYKEHSMTVTEATTLNVVQKRDRVQVADFFWGEQNEYPGIIAECAYL